MNRILLIFLQFSLASLMAFSQSGTVEEPIFLPESNKFYTISGVVTSNRFVLDSFKVYLYREQSQGNIELIDSMYSFNQRGEYLFDKRISGAYYVSAVGLQPNQNYIPTYYGGSAFWAESKTILVQTDMKGKNIDLIKEDQSNIGSGSISGNIVYGDNFINHNKGDFATDIPVLIRNANKQVIRFVKSDENGQYSINNLPIKNLEFFIDIPGKSMIPLTLNFSSDNRSLKEVNFVVEKREVVNRVAAKLSDLNPDLEIQAFPIPFSNYLNLKLSVDKQLTDLKLISNSGARVLSGIPAEGFVRIETSELAPGLHLIEWTAKSGELKHIKVIKK